MKVNVHAKKAPAFPVNRVEIKGAEDLYTFFLRKQDAFDEAKQAQLYRQICDNYLGAPLDVDRKTKKVIRRGEPSLEPVQVGRADGTVMVLRADEDIFYHVAGICVMQDWDGHESECYDPEELMKLAIVDKGVWDEVQTKCGIINDSPLGKDLAPDTGQQQEQHSST